jgi:hypothetical protein
METATIPAVVPTDISGLKRYAALDLTEDALAEYLEGFGKWGGDHIIGVRFAGADGRPINALGEPLDMYMMEPDGPRIQQTSKAGDFLGCIPAGATHHLKGDFGWWHINTSDELYIPTQLRDGRRAYLIVETQPPDRWDVFNWFCRTCNRLLFRKGVHSGKEGVEGFWRTEWEAVQEFNSSERLRTCPDCGSIHPLAYSFRQPEHDKTEW